MSKPFLNKNVATLDVGDVKAMLKRLKDIEPGLVKEYRREIKSIAQPVAKQMKTNIPNQPPLSGMGYVIRRTSKATGSTSYAINEGRLQWQGKGRTDGKGKNFAPDALQISSAIKPSGRSATTPIAKIIMRSAAASMADMAGRKASGKFGTQSREYTYRKRNGELVKRRHRVNGQGANMIRVLQARNSSASRFGWPALEKQIDVVGRQIDQILQKYLDKSFGK
jgi:hypothetical protein